VNGAAEQQQLLGQRRLARVRVRDDGEGPPLRRGVGRADGRLSSGRVGVVHVVVSSGAWARGGAP